jgi:hypothetical protein
MKLNAKDMSALVQAAKHMSGDGKVPLDQRVAALTASFTLEAQLARMSIDVEIETE